MNFTVEILVEILWRSLRLGRIGVAAPVQPPNLGTYDLGEGGWRDVGDGHGFDGAGQSRWVR